MYAAATAAGGILYAQWNLWYFFDVINGHPLSIQCQKQRGKHFFFHSTISLFPSLPSTFHHPRSRFNDFFRIYSHVNGVFSFFFASTYTLIPRIQQYIYHVYCNHTRIYIYIYTIAKNVVIRIVISIFSTLRVAREMIELQ